MLVLPSTEQSRRYSRRHCTTCLGFSLGGTLPLLPQFKPTPNQSRAISIFYTHDTHAPPRPRPRGTLSFINPTLINLEKTQGSISSSSGASRLRFERENRFFPTATPRPRVRVRATCSTPAACRHLQPRSSSNSFPSFAQLSPHSLLLSRPTNPRQSPTPPVGSPSISALVPPVTLIDWLSVDFSLLHQYLSPSTLTTPVRHPAAATISGPVAR